MHTNTIIVVMTIRNLFGFFMPVPKYSTVLFPCQGSPLELADAPAAYPTSNGAGPTAP